MTRTASTNRQARKIRSNASSQTPTIPQSPESKERSQTDVWQQYAFDVVAGVQPANKLVRLACERYLRDLEDADGRGFYFDWVTARRAVKFFELFLCHSKGEWGGQPFVLRPWQAFIVANLFGWKKKSDGLRRFATAYVEVPKKNGKSTLCAGIGLYMLVCDQEPGAEIYAFATKKDQAKIIFDEATRMWDKSPSLQRLVGKFRNNLHVRRTNSKFEPISSEEDTNDGFNPSCGIGDELHRHPNNSLYNLLIFSGASRRQQLMIGVTTAGTNRQSFCYDQHDLAEKILNRVIQNDSIFAFIACLDQEKDGDWKGKWENELEWEKANPNFGFSVRPEKLRDFALQAKQQPTMLNDFLRFHLNVWTQGSIRAISPEAWRLCAGIDTNEPADQVFERWKSELLGKACYGGLDLSDTQDLVAEVYFFPKTEDNPQPRLLPFFFVPEETIERRSKKDRVPYDVWASQGFIIKTPGAVTDYNAIRSHIRQCADDYRLLEMGFDRWNSTQLVTQLAEEDGIKMVAIGQGYLGMSAATKEFLRRITGCEFAHGGNPVLTWNADNLVTTQDAAGNIKPDKSKAREKIDGIVAAIMAINRAMASPDVPGAPRLTVL